MSKLHKLENLTLAIWVGCMIGVGYIAAPVLFSALDDRQMAGMLAGKMFHVVTIIGLICGGILLMLRYRETSIEIFSQWRGWLLILMLTTPQILLIRKWPGRLAWAPAWTKNRLRPRLIILNN